ncbi:hypothetical protein SGPA1_30721 [Streptomyces misionensis JCM 4497]
METGPLPTDCEKTIPCGECRARTSCPQRFLQQAGQRQESCYMKAASQPAPPAGTPDTVRQVRSGRRDAHEAVTGGLQVLIRDLRGEHRRNGETGPCRDGDQRTRLVPHQP